MKRAYLTNGTLVTATTAKSNILTVDSSTWAYLNGLLGTDYCYLIVGNQEVVKVQSIEAPNILLVVRGIDGTNREIWPAGSSIEYGITQAEINDAVTYVGYSLNIQYPLLNTSGTISYDPPQLAGVGGAATSGNGYIWEILDATELGCYNPLAPDMPPDIPLNYFKLRIVTEGYYRSTSQGYYREYE